MWPPEGSDQRLSFKPRVLEVLNGKDMGEHGRAQFAVETPNDTSLQQL